MPLVRKYGFASNRVGRLNVERIRLDEDTGLKPAAGETVRGSSPRLSATVIHVNNAPEDWESDSAYVYIGRGSKWGNRWLVDPLTRREAIERYEKEIVPDRLKELEELRGKILVCCCAPLPCHGDVLVKWLLKS